MPPEAHTPPVSGDTESWVESVQSESPASEQATPPTFESVQTVLGDDNTKELVRLEDNTKFPQSIKQDLMRARNPASERDRPQPPYVEFTCSTKLKVLIALLTSFKSCNVPPSASTARFQATPAF